MAWFPLHARELDYLAELHVGTQFHFYHDNREIYVVELNRYPRHIMIRRLCVYSDGAWVFTDDYSERCNPDMRVFILKIRIERET